MAEQDETLTSKHSHLQICSPEPGGTVWRLLLLDGELPAATICEGEEAAVRLHAARTAVQFPGMTLLGADHTGPAQETAPKRSTENQVEFGIREKRDAR